jgi:hypothetical protein
MKKGQSLARIERDSLASADEMGTGDDLTTAVTTSDVSKVLRLRAEGVEEEPTADLEKSLEQQNS